MDYAEPMLPLQLDGPPPLWAVPDECISLSSERLMELKNVISQDGRYRNLNGEAWEDVFSVWRGIPIKRRKDKRLFDTSQGGNGWSLKSLGKPNVICGKSRIDYVVARADIFGRAKQLGFPGGLSIDSPADELGRAIVKHCQLKHRSDSEALGVRSPFIAILVREKIYTKMRFIYIESPYPELGMDFASSLMWKRKYNQKGGISLTAHRGPSEVFRWHSSGTQLFEIRQVSDRATVFYL